MKNTLAILALFVFSVSAHAGINEALQQADKSARKQQVLEAFQLAYDHASACRDAVQKRNWKAAVKSGDEAVSHRKRGMDLAQRHGVRVFTAIIAPENVPTDPFSSMPDIEEDILFSRVMSGQITLAEALEEGRAFSQSGGLLGAILGVNDKINIAYMNIAEAFRGWKECPSALTSLGDKAKVDPVTFCQPGI